MRRSKRKKKSNKKIILGIIAFLLISIGSGLTYYMYKINQAIDTMYQPVKREETQVKKEEPIIEEPSGKVYLILGADQRRGDKGRTDGIIVATVNDKTHKITLTSIPRDTYVDIANTGHKDKINAAYPTKGIEGSLVTVENFIGIPIDHYIFFNMEGFQKAIDTVGGVRLHLDRNVASYINKETGSRLRGNKEQLLSGEQALAFARFRHDSKGDFGRNDRQQEVVKAFLDQSKSVRSPLKINSLLEILGKDVRMDIEKQDLYSLAKELDEFSSANVEQVKYNATTGSVKGVSYVFISDSERERVGNILKEQLYAK